MQMFYGFLKCLNKTGNTFILLSNFMANKFVNYIINFDGTFKAKFWFLTVWSYNMT